MTESNPRLGRGLAALLGAGIQADSIGASPSEGSAGGAVEEPGREDLTLVAVDRIVPNAGQPRRRFDEAALEALSASIRESGLLQPVVLRPLEGGDYELIAGERRWQASKRAGVSLIPAVIRDASAAERLELALVENVVREDLNPMELARAVASLVEDFGRTHESVASTLGRSRPAISNLIRLLELPEVVAERVERGEISEGHARAILMADGARARRVLAERVVAEGLSVRETEAVARGRRATSADGSIRPAVDPDPAFDLAMDVLYGLFEVPVKVRSTAKGPVVELRFASVEALEEALERLRAQQRFT